MYLAENLKFLREQNGKTQGELAVLFGIEQKTISSWECGSRKPPIGTIVSLAKLYRVSLDDLVLTDMRPPIPVYALNLAYLRKKHGMTQQEIRRKSKDNQGKLLSSERYYGKRYR